MRILIALTYYQPHKSGLTVYAVRLAKALVDRGHQVTVLTSHYNRQLPKYEKVDGVEIIRAPVLFRISKGVIMPTLLALGWRLINKADVVNFHVPQLDAAPLAIMSHLMGKPVVMTYQCDLRLPKGMINWIANRVSFLADRITARVSGAIIAITQDYAENSAFMSRYLNKVKVVTPPVVLPVVEPQDVAAFREKNALHPEQRIIGMVARLATEKGVEYLIEALPQVLQKFPTARVLFVGQYQNVLGEEDYAAKLEPLIRQLGAHWSFLGVISDKDLAAFYHVCDVTVLPSINSTEAFGMVQVEAMTCGTPAVATDLPGVRQPILTSGMGKIVPPRNPDALAQALMDILSQNQHFREKGAEIARIYSPQSTAASYDAIFQELITKK
jgi:glycosyltransferase involved in cell wall biosynthesis